MTGLELNKKIKDICDYNSGVKFNAFAGKPIPYIGWFWRSFDFDNFDRWFGIIPSDDEDNADEISLVGFMVVDKWGYPSVQATEEEWKEILRLLEIAVENPTDETLAPVNETIQALFRPGQTMKIDIGEYFDPFQLGIHSEDGDFFVEVTEEELKEIKQLLEAVDNNASDKNIELAQKALFNLQYNSG